MSNTVKIKRGKMARSKDEAETCGNCRFWVESDDEPQEGTCHRKAPHCQMEGMLQPYDPEEGIPSTTIWPYVGKLEWCGEWEA
jgi:hypothetical protein